MKTDWNEKLVSAKRHHLFRVNRSLDNVLSEANAELEAVEKKARNAIDDIDILKVYNWYDIHNLIVVCRKDWIDFDFGGWNSYVIRKGTRLTYYNAVRLIERFGLGLYSRDTGSKLEEYFNVRINRD